jgi:CheY-like chemotaxis protein
MSVLIVDDDPVNLKLLSYLLRGLSVTSEFTDPVAALAWCSAQAPDMVIVDHLMPGLSGLEFVEHLRALPAGANIPALMISADDDEDLRDRARKLGIDGFLAKPIGKAMLQEQVQRLLVHGRDGS